MSESNPNHDAEVHPVSNEPSTSKLKSPDAKKSKETHDPIFYIENSTADDYPVHFQNIINSIDKSSINENVLLFSAVYGIGLEVGFYNMLEEKPPPLGLFYWGFSYHLDYVNKFSNNFHYKVEAGGQIYTMNLNFMNTTTANNFKLIGIKNGDSYIITLSHLQRATKNSFSVVLSTSKYVPILNLRNVFRCFRELKQLSTKLKDDLFGPARNYFFTIRKQPHPSLIGIPNDQLVSILKYLKNQYNFSNRRSYDRFFTVIGLENLRRD